MLKEHLRVELKRFIQKRTGAKPVITFVISGHSGLGPLAQDLPQTSLSTGKTKS